VSFSFFKVSLKRKKRIQNTIDFSFDVGSNKDNSKAILESSSIKLTRADGFIISFLNFNHKLMADYNASKSN
jgi:hypothetical protein